MHQVNNLNFEQKIGVEINNYDVKCITPIVKLNLKLQC